MKIIKVHFECFSQAKKLLRMFSERKNKIMEKRGITLVRIFFRFVPTFFHYPLSGGTFTMVVKRKKNIARWFSMLCGSFQHIPQKITAFPAIFAQCCIFDASLWKKENLLLLETTRT
jgi:hypothetical protein